MLLKDVWVDKQNGIDDVLAEDINSIAHAVIEIETRVIPTFDLSALGLPTIPSDGSMVSLETDTTEIMAALDKGAVKFIVGFAETQAEVVMNSVGVQGGYICTYMLNSGAPIILTLMFAEGAIQGYLAEIASGGGVTSWNDLTDKPFGESEPVVTEILPTAPITFTFDPEVEPFYIHESAMPIETLYMWYGEWSSATVVWDGVEYVCEPKEIYGMKVCGNIDYYLGSGDSGEPFLMIMGEGPDNNAMIILYDLKTAPEDATVVSTVERSVGASLNVVEIKTLDPKFIGSVEWDKISGRPFGTVPSGTVLFDDALTLSGTETDGEGNTVYVYIGLSPDPFVPPDGTTIMLEYGGGEYGGIVSDGVVEVTINDKAFRFGWNFGVFMVETYISEPPDIVVSLGSDAIVKLPEEYLPDGIGGGGAVSKPVSVDMSGLDTNGTIVETYADGTTKTTTMEFDENGNPTKITDGDGNVTTLTW